MKIIAGKEKTKERDRNELRVKSSLETETEQGTKTEYF